MKEAEILGRHITIEGFRGVKIENIEVFLDQAKKETEGCQVQFFDAKFIAGFDHLYFAVLNASKAYETSKNISKNLAVEILLYASGQHQISRAIGLLGMKLDSSQMAVLVAADTRQKAIKALNRISDLLQGEKDDEVIELTDEKVAIIKAAFGITDLEIEATLRKSEKEALTNLLVERMALLSTRS
jgi:KEOPS complex subunit Cgi121